MLVSSALVLLMVPGLALFYGGLVRRKNVLTTMLHSFAAMGIIGVQWIVIGYMLAFGSSVGGWIGWDPSLVGLLGLPYTRNFADKAIPELVFVMFQGKFAIITPCAHQRGGGRADEVLGLRLLRPAVDHAHLLPAGALGLGVRRLAVSSTACSTSLAGRSSMSRRASPRWCSPSWSGARRDYRPGHSAILPHNLTLTLLGAGLLWFGWFGFNAGSAVAAEHPVAGHVAGLAFATTQTAAASAALTWLLIEWWHQRRPTSLGLVSGILAGLVAITPAAGHVIPAAALRHRRPRGSGVLRRGAGEATLRVRRCARRIRRSTASAACSARCSRACSASLPSRAW